MIETLEYYPNLFLVGDVTPAGWDLAQAPSLTADPSNPAVFSWTGILSEGSFKIGTARTFDNGWDWIHPLAHGQALNSNSYEVVEAGSGSDNQWVIDAATAGAYFITLDFVAKTIIFNKSPASSINSFQKSTTKLRVSNNGHKLITSGMENYDFVIYNLSGAKVNNGFCGDGVIDVSNLRAGVYILRINSVTTGNSVFKFVKN